MKIKLYSVLNFELVSVPEILYTIANWFVCSLYLSLTL